MTKVLSKTLSVCAITTWPPYRDGIALYSAKLYERIADLAYVEVIANKVGAYIPSIYSENSIVVRRSWTRGGIFSLLQIFCQAVKSKAHLLHIHYGWLLYGFPSTLLIPFLLLTIRLTRKPIVLTMHTVIQRNAKIYDNNLLNKTTNFVIFTLTKLLTKFSYMVIVHNYLMKKSLEENYGCKGKRIVVIPHGVVRASLEKWNRNNTSDKLKILSLGFLRKEKKLEYLLRAFFEFSLENPNVQLFLIGGPHPHDNDEYAQNIKKLINDLKLEDKVYLINFVSEGELNKLIHDSDFIVLVSTKDYFIETSGALARVADFGKPVVCSRVPKFQGELKDGYNCLMVTPENVDELVKAMKILAKNNKLKRQLASNLRKHFKSRYWTEVAKMHVSCYGSLLRVRREM